MLKNPFYIRSLHDRLSVHLNLPDLLLLWPILTLLSFLLTISFSCIKTFPCSEFLPTISYLAAYTYYDRFIIFIITAQVLPLILFFLASFLFYSKHISKIDSWVLLLISFFATLALPSVVVIDEVNSSYYFPFDKIHAIVLSGIICVFAIWIGFSFEWLYKTYKEQPRKDIKYVGGYILLCYFSLLLSYKEWKTAERVEDYFALALSEYLTIGLFAFLPRVYCCAMHGIRISMDRVKISTEDE